ncbi:LysR family transcriptional regulator [Amycolatopsis acidicola]|uniref:LysR family transcriptional regulator n=1 Tax=Amycolatopsis acidicola TaxID=2596893 RepID=A0A5N0V1N9_9PSEU|nr:LysR family transcriptional regulator [Amycolatopsis acidicola]KAA9158713.1 LysR family transcriptional regulator [Amycolatopsis acidicola]
MDRITVMRSFVAVGEHGSFSRAARGLGISGSLVSRHIAELEKQLGVRLVNRTARAVTLSSVGRRYYDFSRRIIEEIDHEDEALRGVFDKAEGPLAVICPKWIGNLDLGEAIADFAVDHPKIHVRFEVGGMSDRTFDFLDKGYDIAFHTRDLRDSTLLVRKIADIDFVLCAAPSYLKEADALADPAAIAEHDCLVHINDPVWHLRRDGEETRLKILSTVYSSNSYLTLRKAAVRGRGLALMPKRTVMADLDNGDLERVLPAYDGPARSLYAVHSPGSHTMRKVRLFLDYITVWFRRHPLTDGTTPSSTQGANSQ